MKVCGTGFYPEPFKLQLPHKTRTIVLESARDIYSKQQKSSSENCSILKRHLKGMICDFKTTGSGSAINVRSELKIRFM